MASAVREIADTKLSTWVASKQPGQPKQNFKKPICNATLVNLSFMALVSAAPLIFLNIIDTCWTLGDQQG